MGQKYDIAAYVWPAFTGREMRSRIFWPAGIGEWQTVFSADTNAPIKNGYVWGRRPLWGPVDEADPAVMEQQIEQATHYGVNVFIYDWYWYDRRPFLEQCLNEGFLGARNNGKMRFYLMWANHNANCAWNMQLADLPGGCCDVWEGTVDRPEFDRVVRRVIDRYFSLPNYYKIDGKPVFQIYDTENLIRGLGSPEQAREALRYFREETVKAGFPGLMLQMTGWGNKVSNLSGVDGERHYSAEELCTALAYDSVTNYQFVHFCDMNRPYPDILADAMQEWERMAQKSPVPYFPHVSVGWDNNPRFRSFRPTVCRGNTPAEVEKAFAAAKAYIDSHNLPAPLVTVNSWNEWTETSYLQPDNVNGYGYLEALRRVFGAE